MGEINNGSQKIRVLLIENLWRVAVEITRILVEGGGRDPNLNLSELE